VILLVLTFLPCYLLIGARSGGPAVEQTVRLGRAYSTALWTGSIVAVAGVALLGLLLRPVTLAPLGKKAEQWLLAPSAPTLGLTLGVVAALASIWVSNAVLNRAPALVDGISQLVQGRYFAAGALAGPVLADPEFWQFQYMVSTDTGWVSQYPPGFAALLAAGWWLGAPWLVGPAALGVAVFLTTLIGERFFPDDVIVARLGGVLTAVSPVLIFHAAAYMNHALALMLLTIALYAALRSVEGSWRWSLLAGAAWGAMFATRPYAAVVLGAFAIIVAWLGAPGSGAMQRAILARRLAGAAAGAAPFLAGVLGFNARLFGNPLLFGYIAAEGPGHGPGFHVDPWGNPYGVAEAVGQTSADLAALSTDLLQAPIPTVGMIALFLLLSRRPGRGAALAAGWALLPVAANAFYWHHDLFMGPRLLYEAIPGWCLLLAAASVWLIRSLRRRHFLSNGVAAVLVSGLAVAVFYAGPRKLASYRRTPESTALRAPVAENDRPSIVFVHGSWEARLASRMSALGMRLDSVRLALRHNSTCRVELWVTGRESAREGGGQREERAEELRFAGSAGPPLRELRLPSGPVIRSSAGELLDPRCERQAASDFRGVIELAPLVWQGDLPGIGSDGAMFVRDFGPERNLRLLERFPHREPRVLLRTRNQIRLAPYEQGMAQLWSEE
jgi:hypothetical protein